MEKAIDKKRSIGEAAKEIGVETHVIRFWELKFPQIKPEIGAGSRRYYFDKEMAVLTKIKSLLHDEGYSIAGLQKLLKKRKQSNLKEQNIEFLITENEAVKPQEKAPNDFSIDDFIKPNAAVVDVDVVSLNPDVVSVVNKLIAKIEASLASIK